jgi:toxin secretion/phage lysis holin
MTKENVFFGALTGLSAYFLGLPYELLFCWLILMLLDVAVGIIGAAIKGEFSSKEMKYGLFRKVFDVAVMTSLLVIQRVAELNGINVPFGSIIVGAFCFKELSSILENYANAGGKIPAVVSSWLKVINTKLDDKAKEDDDDDKSV